MTRPEILYPYFSSLTSLAGIGQKVEKSFAKIHVTRLKDLLFHLPVSVVERREITTNLSNFVGFHILIQVLIAGHRPGRNSRSPYRVRVFYQGSPLDLMFFHGGANYLGQILPSGQMRWVAGKLEQYGDDFQIVHPSHITHTRDEVPLIEPQYSLTEGISQKFITKSIHQVIKKLTPLPEWQHQNTITKRGFPSFYEALKEIHNPQNAASLGLQSKVRLRLAYDELLSHQLALALIREKRKPVRGKVVKADPSSLKAALDLLPFPLTGAQERALKEISDDLSSTNRMFRMLQGDVGSGKTAVAYLAMVITVAAGFQAALLAPTEILARQHFETLKPLFEVLGMNTVLLTGRDRQSERREVLSAVKRGEAKIIIGTHAIFQESVEFAELGLAIIDEQHRFGVRERLKLVEKGGKVDILSMSATPIPRSLAMVIYGEMDISILDEKPQGRKPIKTSLFSSRKLPELIEHLRDALVMGRQVYWVCPLVSESEVLDLANVESRYLHLKALFGEDMVGLVHGRLAGSEKEAVMSAFRDGRIKILVATTVIEVGVDVPKASIMLIEGAERFGLAQLHQLRGRVGRGSIASDCILIYNDGASQVARQRLDLMRATDDGFELAEADLRMRGEGDMIGTAQSGSPDYHFANLEAHLDLVKEARDDARLILETDPELCGDRGQNLRILLYLMEREQSVGLISAT